MSTKEHQLVLMRHVASAWVTRGADMPIALLMSRATDEFWRELLLVYGPPDAETSYQLGAQFAFMLIAKLAKAHLAKAEES